MGIFHYYKLPNSEMFVFDEFLICQIKEGADIKPELNERLNKIIQTHFEGKNIVYISKRKFLFYRSLVVF